MIVCGLQLDARERELLIQHSVGLSIQDTVTPGSLGRGSVCFPDLPLASVVELPAWGLPVLVWCGESVREAGMRARLFEAGVAAAWWPSTQLKGAAPFPLLAPACDIPQRKTEQAIIVLPGGGSARILKQLFLFAGISTRADFPNAADFAVALPSLREEHAHSMHLVIDLDRPDFVAALHALSKKPDPPPGGVHVWALRDFSLPGPDPALMQRLLSPFTTRVFEPLEAVVALIEALFLSPAGLDRASALKHPLQNFDGFRDADQLLHGRSVQLLHSDPRIIWQATASLLESMRPSLPFHWLLDYYEEQRRGGGLLLAVNPDENRAPTSRRP